MWRLLYPNVWSTFCLWFRNLWCLVSLCPVPQLSFLYNFSPLFSSVTCSHALTVALSYLVNRHSVMSRPVFGEQSNRQGDKFNGICHLLQLEPVCVVHTVVHIVVEEVWELSLPSVQVLALTGFRAAQRLCIPAAGRAEWDSPGCRFCLLSLEILNLHSSFQLVLLNSHSGLTATIKKEKIWKTRVVCYPSLLRLVHRKGQETPGKASQETEVSPRSQCQERALYKTASNKTTKGMHVLHLSYIIYEQL